MVLIDPTKLTTHFHAPSVTNNKEVFKLKKEIKDITQSSDFSASPLVQFFHKVEYENISIGIHEALEINLYPLMQPEINFRLKTNQNMNWTIYGSPGSGKSLSGLFLYQMISCSTGIPIKTRNMYTDGALLYRRLLSLFESKMGKKDLCRNDVIFTDENVREQTGLGAVHQTLQTTEMEVRIRAMMIHFIWVSTMLYSHQSAMVLETFDVERDKNNLEIIKRIRLLCYNYNNILMGSIILPAPEQEVIKAYHKHIKFKSIETFFSGVSSSRARLMREIAEECIQDKNFKVLQNKEQRLQFIEEHYGMLNLTLGQQMRILGLTKGLRKGDDNGNEHSNSDEDEEIKAKPTQAKST